MEIRVFNLYQIEIYPITGFVEESNKFIEI